MYITSCVSISRAFGGENLTWLESVAKSGSRESSSRRRRKIKKKLLVVVEVRHLKRALHPATRKGQKIFPFHHLDYCTTIPAMPLWRRGLISNPHQQQQQQPTSAPSHLRLNQVLRLVLGRRQTALTDLTRLTTSRPKQIRLRVKPWKRMRDVRSYVIWKTMTKLDPIFPAPRQKVQVCQSTQTCQ